MKNYQIFLIICLYSFVLIFAWNSLIITNELYFTSFEEQFTYSKIQDLISESKAYQWAAYCFAPLIYALKFFTISLILLIGFYFSDVKVKLSQLFKIVQLSELPFLFLAFFKFYWFYFIKTQYNLNDLQYFSPLSLLQIFDHIQLEKWQMYPLQLLNAFEFTYWFLLIYWSQKMTKVSFKDGMKIVLGSYLPALLLWVVFMVFLTINLNG